MGIIIFVNANSYVVLFGANICKPLKILESSAYRKFAVDIACKSQRKLPVVNGIYAYSAEIGCSPYKLAVSIPCQIDQVFGITETASL